MSELITVTQLRVLRMIRLLGEVGYAPSVRELGYALDIASTNGVQDHLRALKKRGLVAWVPHTARTLSLTEAGAAWLEVTPEELTVRIAKAKGVRRIARSAGRSA